MSFKQGSPSRAQNEIEHGRKLACEDTEAVWGWGTPAGKLRARRRADLIAEHAGLRAGQLALEIGCGTGLFTECFAASGARVVAVDISPDLLAKARLRNLDESRVTFFEARFEDAGLHGPFDAVLGSSILHHLEIRESLRKIYELLKPGGCMSFAEPNMLNPQVWMERRFCHLPMFSYTSPDETAFVRWRLARDLGEAGFTEVRVVPFDWLHPGTPPAAIPLVRNLGLLLERLPLIRELSGSLLISARRPG